MHELGIVIEIVKQVEEFSKSNNINEIDTLVLQVGELSGIVPRYIEEVYPIAVEKTTLKNTKLSIEVTPGLGRCKSCDFTYNLFQNNNTCPICDSNEYEVLSGTDFMIKEILAK